jgi:hypothetical protein
LEFLRLRQFRDPKGFLGQPGRQTNQCILPDKAPIDKKTFRVALGQALVRKNYHQKMFLDAPKWMATKIEPQTWRFEVKLRVHSSRQNGMKPDSILHFTSA